MTKPEFLQLWRDNQDGRHNAALALAMAKIFAPEKQDNSKPHIKFYDFVVTDASKGGRLVERKYIT